MPRDPRTTKNAAREFEAGKRPRAASTSVCRDCMVERDGFEPEVSLAVLPTAQSETPVPPKSATACLRRSGASRASSGGVCGAQPHAHQRILLQPGIRHLTCSPRWPALWLKLDVAQDVPRILQCIMNGQRCRSFRGEVAPGPVAQAIVAVLPRRPAKRRRSRSRHVKAYVAVHNGRRRTTNSQPGMIR